MKKLIFAFMIATLSLGTMYAETVQMESSAEASAYVPGKYPQGSTRRLTESDLYGLSDFELKIMRNEIYARHGYIFQTPAMNNYFANQSWYTPRSSNVNLTSLEYANVQFIKAYEQSGGTVTKNNTDVKYSFRGTIGRYKVHMKLAFDRGNKTVTGTYYDSQRAKGKNALLRLKGYYTNWFEYGGTLYLKEYDASGKEIGYFQCAMSHLRELDEYGRTSAIFYQISSNTGYTNRANGKTYSVDLESVN